jgi:hypothetical protein
MLTDYMPTEPQLMRRAAHRLDPDGTGIGAAFQREVSEGPDARRFLCAVTDGRDWGWVEIEFPCMDHRIEIDPEAIEQALERLAGDFPVEARLDCLVHEAPHRVSRERRRDLLRS